MTDRNAIQREIEDKLASAEHSLRDLKAKLNDAGHEASRELADAAHAAERTVEKGKAKLAQLAAATTASASGRTRISSQRPSCG